MPLPTAQPPPTAHRPRRKLRTYLHYALLAVALTAVGLTLRSAHRIRQTEEAVAELRQLGVSVSDTFETDEFWRTFTRSVGLSPNNGLFERAVYTVKIDGGRLGSDALRAAALRAAVRLPDLIDLRISNVADIDDALAAMRDCTELRNIAFYKTGVTDIGLKHLRHCKRLQSVDLGACPVTDEGIHFLCSLPAIRRLSCGHCLSATTLDELVYTSPEAPTPQPGRPLTITGRLRLKSPVPVTTATLRLFVINEDVPQPASLQATVGVALDAANQAVFSVIAKNGGAELQPGRNVLYVNVMLPSTPALNFHLQRDVPIVHPDAP
jgi:hypothetical protein